MLIKLRYYECITVCDGELCQVIWVFESAKLDFFCAAYFAISSDSFYVQALQMFNPIPFYVLFSIFPTLVFPSTVISQVALFFVSSVLRFFP